MRFFLFSFFEIASCQESMIITCFISFFWIAYQFANNLQIIQEYFFSIFYNFDFFRNKGKQAAIFFHIAIGASWQERFFPGIHSIYSFHS